MGQPRAPDRDGWMEYCTRAISPSEGSQAGRPRIAPPPVGRERTPRRVMAHRLARWSGKGRFLGARRSVAPPAWLLSPALHETVLRHDADLLRQRRAPPRHAYTTIAADVLARYHGCAVGDACFLTGTDEHGQKIERAAAEQGLAPQAFCRPDACADVPRAAWRGARVRARRLHPHDRAAAQERASGAVEAHRGAAATSTSASTRAGTASAARLLHREGARRPATSARCTSKPVERVKEPSYFFRLSSTQSRCSPTTSSTPSSCSPQGRFNEVKSFVREGLRDLSVSRTTFRWGIPVPGDPEHVMYVWFDALTNYMTALGGRRGRALRASGRRTARPCTSSARTSCASTPSTGRRSC